MLLELDLAGADWAVVANLSGDQNMMGVLKSGESPHIVTGMLMSGLSKDLLEREDELLKKFKDVDDIAYCRKEKIPEIFTASFLPRTMSIRQAAKKGNHGGNYREGPRMFAMTNEMDEVDAKKILDKYTCQSPAHGKHGHTCGNVAYPGIRAWWDKTDAQIRATRTLQNCFGRKVYFTQQMGDDLFKAAYSFVPQSTVFDITAMGMRKFMDDGSSDFAPASQIRAQVHDSLLFDYLSQDFMAMARFVVKQVTYMSPTIHYTEDFVLRVTLKGGLIWRDLKDIPISDNITELADRLEIHWKKCHEARKAIEIAA